MEDPLNSDLPQQLLHKLHTLRLGMWDPHGRLCTLGLDDLLGFGCCHVLRVQEALQALKL